MAVDERPLQLGDRVQLRKKHPCGSDEWLIVRLGADIGLQCVGCGRRILLVRSALRKQMKRIVKPADEAGTDPE